MTSTLKRAGLSAIGLIAALLFVALTPVPSSAEDAACVMFTDAAKNTNAAGPVAIDGTTTQEQVTVSCETKTIDTKFVSTEPASALPQGWKGDSEKKLSALYCDDPASRDIIGSGWTIEETTAFADGTSLTIKAACQ